MYNQNVTNKRKYKNQRQIIPFYHGLALLALMAIWVIIILKMIRNDQGSRMAQIILLLVFVIPTSLYYYNRTITLKAQDRAIRAEENLRHSLLTGEPLDHRVTVSQIIALRFASDDEYPALVKRAAEEGLSDKEIREQIKKQRSNEDRA